MLVAGVDEAGRGPLAGPVVVAAVILPDRATPYRDSKQMSARQRERAFLEITSQAYYHIAIIEPEQIDRLNILQATLLGMRQAVLGLAVPPAQVLVDGHIAPDLPYPTTALIKGDQRESVIAAASILAKVTRDRLLIELDAEFPQYGFAQHKGYPTQQHLRALKDYGPCCAHRRSYAPVKAVL